MALRPSRRNAPFSAFSSNFTSFSISRPGCTRAAGAHAHIFLSSPSRPGYGVPLDVQYYTRPGCKRRIDMGKALGHIFMHGRFTDPKFPGRLPHCRIVVYDVISDRNRPFLDIFLHGSSPENVFYILLHLFPLYANSLSQTKTLPISSSPHGGVSASRFSSRQLPTLPSPHRSRQAVPELPSDARFHPALP